LLQSPAGRQQKKTRLHHGLSNSRPKGGLSSQGRSLGNARGKMGPGGAAASPRGNFNVKHGFRRLHFSGKTRLGPASCRNSGGSGNRKLRKLAVKFFGGRPGGVFAFPTPERRALHFHNGPPQDRRCIGKLLRKGTASQNMGHFGPTLRGRHRPDCWRQLTFHHRPPAIDKGLTPGSLESC